VFNSRIWKYPLPFEKFLKVGSELSLIPCFPKGPVVRLGCPKPANHVKFVQEFYHLKTSCPEASQFSTFVER